MTGRPPRPLQVQQNEGDPRQRGKHKLAQRLAAQPKAEAGLPDCPERLRGIARDTWYSVKQDLEVMQLHQRPGAYEIEMFCVNRARAIEADEQIERDGITREINHYDKDGNLLWTDFKQHAAIKTSNEAWKKVQEFAAAYGLNPVSRTRLAVERPDDPTEELSALLSKPRPKREVEAVQ